MWFRLKVFQFVISRKTSAFMSFFPPLLLYLVLDMWVDFDNGSCKKWFFNDMLKIFSLLKNQTCFSVSKSTANMKAGQYFYHEPQTWMILSFSEIKGHSRVCRITLPPAPPFLIISSVYEYLRKKLEWHIQKVAQEILLVKPELGTSRVPKLSVDSSHK